MLNREKLSFHKFLSSFMKIYLHLFEAIEAVSIKIGGNIICLWYQPFFLDTMIIYLY